MAYPDDQLKRSDPHAPQGRADPGPLGGARSGGSRLTGILVAVILILGVVFAVNLFLGAGETDTTDTTVPGDGAVAPATGGADDTAPVASDAPAE